MLGFAITAHDHDGIAYYHLPPLRLGTPEGENTLRALINNNTFGLLIIDSLRRAAPGLDENDSTQVSAVFSPLRVISAKTGCTILVIHHARKRIGDNPTDAGQMVRGSGDLLASVDTLLYLRAKEAGSFILEHAASRRSLPGEPILVRIQDNDGTVQLVNEGPVAMAEDKVEALLARIIETLRDDGGPLGRPQLALRLSVRGNDGTFSRALKLGWQRGTPRTSDAWLAARGFISRRSRSRSSWPWAPSESGCAALASS